MNHFDARRHTAEVEKTSHTHTHTVIILSSYIHYDDTYVGFVYLNNGSYDGKGARVSRHFKCIFHILSILQFELTVEDSYWDILTVSKFRTAAACYNCNFKILHMVHASTHWHCSFKRFLCQQPPALLHPDFLRKLQQAN